MRRTLEEGLQVVTCRGEDVIVAVRAEGFDRLNLGEEGLKEASSGRRIWRLWKIRRDKGTMRDVELG